MTNSTKRIVVLGGGSGGVAAATRLGRRLGETHSITMVDRRAEHVFMPGFLFLLVGQRRPEDLVRSLKKLEKRNVRVVQAEVAGIDVDRQRVMLDSGPLPYDYLIISLGMRTVTDMIPGSEEGGHHAWELDAAVSANRALESFQGGKVLVGVPPGPYRCPPGPYETLWLLDSYFRDNGMRDRVQIEYFTPNQEPVGREDDPAVYMDKENRDRGITNHYGFSAQSVDPDRRRVNGMYGYSLSYDLLFMVPRHEPQQVLLDSGLVDSRAGIGVDYSTLATRYENVFAIGDCADVPASKSGVVAHQEADVVAHNIEVAITGRGRPTTLCLHTI